ncbi:hypothetical protein BJX70DRAFT_105153 [Aspergillus crustosus]
MEAPTNSLASLHFAMLYIDADGKLCFDSSSSIANSRQSILSPKVTDSFLRAVARSGGEIDRASSPTSPTTSHHSSFPQHADHHQAKRQRTSHDYTLPPSVTSYPQAMLPIRDKNLLRRYYEQAFDNLQQTNCRILAKAYIRHVEPRKQVNFPYNGRKIIAGTPKQYDPENTKPAWWPAGVVHREPDHLRKPERIRLLVHILCGLRESHSMCVEKLREADQAIRRQLSPAKRLQVLDEIYRVRREEERYLDGDIDALAVVSVSRVNMPDLIDAQPLLLYASAETTQNPDNIPGRHENFPNPDPHISVLPSSSSPSSQISISISRTEADLAPGLAPAHIPPIPTTWAFDPTISVPASLPSISTAIRLPSTDTIMTMTPYADDLSTPPIFSHHEPANLQAQSYFSHPYANTQPQQQPHPNRAPLHFPHQNGGHQFLHHHPHPHPHPQPTVPVTLPPATSFDNCPQPFYFDY